MKVAAAVVSLMAMTVQGGPVSNFVEEVMPPWCKCDVITGGQCPGVVSSLAGCAKSGSQQASFDEYLADYGTYDCSDPDDTIADLCACCTCECDGYTTPWIDWFASSSPLALLFS